MKVAEHDSKGYGMKVWLSQSDVDALLDVDSVERHIAYSLAVRCGLRTKEVLEVCPSDVVEAGTMLEVDDCKGEERKTPIPTDLATTIRSADAYRSESADTPIVSITTTRGLRKMIERRRDRLESDTGDWAWRNVSWHDLRRTWATEVFDSGVHIQSVMDWGGWGSVETFLDYYHEDANSPEAQRREREKVEWL